MGSLHAPGRIDDDGLHRWFGRVRLRARVVLLCLPSCGCPCHLVCHRSPEAGGPLVGRDAGGWHGAAGRPRPRPAGQALRGCRCLCVAGRPGGGGPRPRGPAGEFHRAWNRVAGPRSWRAWPADREPAAQGPGAEGVPVRTAGTGCRAPSGRGRRQLRAADCRCPRTVAHVAHRDPPLVGCDRTMRPSAVWRGSGPLGRRRCRPPRCWRAVGASPPRLPVRTPARPVDGADRLCDRRGSPGRHPAASATASASPWLPRTGRRAEASHTGLVRRARGTRYTAWAGARPAFHCATSARTSRSSGPLIGCGSGRRRRPVKTACGARPPWTALVFGAFLLWFMFSDN